MTGLHEQTITIESFNHVGFYFLNLAPKGKERCDYTIMVEQHEEIEMPEDYDWEELPHRFVLHATTDAQNFKSLLMTLVTLCENCLEEKILFRV